MQEQEIYSRLTKIFRDIFDEGSLTLTPGLNAADVEGWDSFNHINLIAATEAEFGIRFHTAEIESLDNVGRLVQLVSQKQASRA